MADIVIDRSDAQIKTGIEKIADVSSSASEIDNAVDNHITQAELNAVVLDSGNITPEQAATIDGLSNMESTGAEIDNVVQKTLNTKIDYESISGLRLSSTANLAYSDTTFGNLGSDFTATFLLKLDQSFTTLRTLFGKGDSSSDGWGLVVVGNDLTFRVKGVDDTIIDIRSISGYNFFSIVSNSTETKLLLNNVTISTVSNALTTSSDALALASDADAWRTTNVFYASFISEALSLSEIKKEIALVTSKSSLISMQRDFVTLPEKLDLKGWRFDGKELKSVGDNVAIFADLSSLESANYSRLNFAEEPLRYLKPQTGNETAFILADRTQTAQAFLSEEIEVKNLDTITIMNSWDYLPYSYYFFRDKNGVILEVGKTGTTYTQTATVNITIDVPENAETFQANLHTDSYIVKDEDSKKKLEYVTPEVVGSKDLGITAIMPSYFYCSDTVYYIDPVASADPILAVSQTTNTITLEAGIESLFVQYRGYNVVALLSDDSYVNLFVSRNSDTTLTIHNTTLSLTVVSVRGVSNEGGGMIHLSDPANIVASKAIVESTEDITNYKRLRYFGFEPNTTSLAPIKQFTPLIDGFGNVLGFNDKPAFSYSSDDTVQRSTISSDYSSRISTRGMNVDTPTVKFSATAGANILTMKTNSPFLSGCFEVRSTAPKLDESGSIPSIPITMNIYNDDVLVHTEIVNGYKIHRTKVSRTDWNNIKLEFTCASDGDVLLVLLSAIMWETDETMFADSITSDSVVAWLGDSWQLANENDLDTFEGLYRNLEGVESSYTGSAYLSRGLRTETGCELEFWGEGGKTGKWALEKQIFNLIHRKRFTHVVVEYWWNDKSLLGDKWLGYFSLLCRILVANGIRPIVFCPSLVEFDVNTRMLEKHVLE